MIDEEITLRKLEIFCAFMQKENIARTAEQLKMSSVSVHRALHSLEEGIQCPLFIHKGRQLLPLPTAKNLCASVRPLLADLERNIQETRRLGGVDDSRMRLGSLYSLTVQTIPRLIMGTKFRRPNLEFDLTMGSNAALLSKLAENKLDAIVIALDKSEIDRTRFEVLPLFVDELYVAVPAAHVKLSGDEIGLEELRNEKFVTLSEGFATYQDFVSAFELADYKPEIVTQVKDIFSMLNLVQAGLGVALLPGRMCRVYESLVKYLRLSDKYQQRQQIGIVFDRNREHEANFRALVAEGRMYSRFYGKEEPGAGYR